eukprot:250577-Chlamydomonas_euryale.AAC.2
MMMAGWHGGQRAGTCDAPRRPASRLPVIWLATRPEFAPKDLPLYTALGFVPPVSPCTLP